MRQVQFSDGEAAVRSDARNPVTAGCRSDARLVLTVRGKRRENAIEMFEVGNEEIQDILSCIYTNKTEIKFEVNAAMGASDVGKDVFFNNVNNDDNLIKQSFQEEYS